MRGAEVAGVRQVVLAVEHPPVLHPTPRPQLPLQAGPLLGCARLQAGQWVSSMLDSLNNLLSVGGGGSESLPVDQDSDGSAAGRL